MGPPDILIGTAGWQAPKTRAEFPMDGSHLPRYSAVFWAVEINTSFYRLHRPQTYARWRGDTPPGFRFALKIPRMFTHAGRLRTLEGIDEFLAGVLELGEKLGPLLVQLPPSLKLEPESAGAFFQGLRARFSGLVVCEPRHASWFTSTGEALLAVHRIARAAADPAVVPAAGEPGGWRGLAYFRLHGTPQMYVSPYGPARVARLAERLHAERAGGTETWAIFDNTAEGHALDDALELLRHVG